MKTQTETTEPRAAGEAAQPHSLLRTFELTREFMAEFTELFVKIPEFNRWTAGVALLYGSMLQFHPHPDDKWDEPIPLNERKASALKIARAIGGTWTKGTKSWDGEATLPSGQRFKIVLHDVEHEEREPIDISAPEAEAAAV